MPVFAWCNVARACGCLLAMFQPVAKPDVPSIYGAEGLPPKGEVDRLNIFYLFVYFVNINVDLI